MSRPSSTIVLRLAEHEVEAAGEPSFVLGGTDQQLLAKQAIGTVLGLTREIELRGQHAATARLHLHMDMARAADIDAGHNALEPVAPVRIGELMTAQAEAGIVILPLVVGLPELQERARDRLAVAREHEADQLDRLARHAGFNQFDPLGRGRLEEWS